MDEKRAPRRDFFKKIALGFTAASLLKPKKLLSQGLFSGILGKPADERKGIVVIAREDGFSRKAPSKTRYDSSSRMLGKSVCALMGENDTKAAWTKVLHKDSVVGIKLNCVAAPSLSPNKELVDAIVDGIKLAGVSENNIIIWERSERELERAGFRINESTQGVRCFATDSAGVGFEEEIEESGSIGSLFSKIISRISDVLINVGVLKDHDLSGVCAGMKNLYGLIHNPNKYHGDNCNPYLADLCKHRFIKDKMRLTVIDASTCQYHGGPGFKPDFSSEFNSILVGKDMVSIDRVAHDLIEQERKRKGLKSLAEEKRSPSYITTAADYGLGEGDLKKIKIIKV